MPPGSHAGVSLAQRCPNPTSQFEDNDIMSVKIVTKILRDLSELRQLDM